MSLELFEYLLIWKTQFYFRVHCSDNVSLTIMSTVIISLKKIVPTTEALCIIITLGQLPMLTVVQKHAIYLPSVNTGCITLIIVNASHLIRVIGHVLQLQARNIQILKNVQAS